MLIIYYLIVFLCKCFKKVIKMLTKRLKTVENIFCNHEKPILKVLYKFFNQDNFVGCLNHNNTPCILSF